MTDTHEKYAQLVHFTKKIQTVDAEANKSGGPQISMENSPVSGWVIPTDEEWMIARHTCDTLGLV